MIISVTAEYALRAMAQIAALGDDEAVRAQDVSELAHVPPSYLSKILRRLVAAGLLESEKGHGGGFRLARAPGKISFADIFEALGEDPNPHHCAFGWGACSQQNPCLLHASFSELRTQTERWARSSTLAMAVADPGLVARGPKSSGRGRSA